jgi:hypothetical protein
MAGQLKRSHPHLCGMWTRRGPDVRNGSQSPKELLQLIRTRFCYGI